MARVIYADIEISQTVSMDRMNAVYGAGIGGWLAAAGSWAWSHRSQLMQSGRVLWNAGQQLYQIWR